MYSQKNQYILSAIIVDDEFYGRENLNKLIETYCPDVKILGLADSVIEAKQLVEKNNPDIVFLDINMPVLDGFDFLKEFDKREFMTVLVSAHKEYGIKAIKAGAVDYLLKPINIKELKETIKRLIELKINKPAVEVFTEPDKILIPASHGVAAILIDDIIRLEADRSYTIVYLNGEQSVIVTKTLKEFDDRLPKDKFYRVHKSHLINLKYFKKFSNLDGNHIIMTDGSKIELARRKAPEFIQKIKSAMKSI